MKLLRRLIVAISFTLLSNTAFSTTVKWLVKPTFDRIEACSEHIFKCYQNGKILLYDDSGISLLPNPCDSVTFFSEGYALVLDKGIDDTRWLIKGLLREEYPQFIEVKGKFYTMLYSFFSEGMLAVGNSESRYGYLNTQGQEVIPCRYLKARPFIQGWAAVQTEGDMTLYINSSMIPMKLDFHHGEVNDGTSFNQDGEAVVIHYKTKDLAVINKDGKVLRKYRQPKHVKKFYRSYDRAFCEDCDDAKPLVIFNPKIDPEITTYESNGKYGYHLSGSTVLPAQFSHVEAFANGRAIVAQEGRYGILSIVEGDITTNIKGGNAAIDPFKKAPTLTLQLEVPEGMPPIQVKFDKGDGNMNPVELKKNAYSFKPYITKNSKSCIIRYEVYCDGILLLEESLALNIQQDALRFTVTPPVSTSEHANHKDIQTIKASVTNNSTTPIQVAVTFAASFQANSANNLVNPTSEGDLMPGETKDFTTSVMVKSAENVKVTVTVNANNKKKETATATIALTPYD